MMNCEQISIQWDSSACLKLSLKIKEKYSIPNPFVFDIIKEGDKKPRYHRVKEMTSLRGQVNLLEILLKHPRYL